ncbi:flavodoxin [Bacteroidales bacterium]|uniref:flavodoxin n=1 Tax=Tenuifilum sp. TaxID=2760880 RepID=UPI001B44DA5C|nr:flavodoxin [Bacteroidales bacterium]HOK84989.1 flavodoxin [Tenuifilum sp.]HPP89234.1 flavodoxin [Tenuifilum sp.]HRR10405.1 flavodoxin [Tenuifilum sp.]HRU85186.1 flavodoxin [Tenuifilum sp.]
MNKRIGIFYGPTGGSTEKVAQLIAKELGAIADLHPIKEASPSMVNNYDIIVFGCSTIGSETWNGEASRSDWDHFRPELKKIQVQGKLFAFFGTGDSVTYPRNFVDGMGILAKELIAQGAQVIGQWPTDGYSFTDSEALINGKFIGLPIDEDYEADKTIARVKGWVELIKKSI